jgi:hypothetical protein
MKMKIVSISGIEPIEGCAYDNNIKAKLECSPEGELSFDLELKIDFVRSDFATLTLEQISARVLTRGYEILESVIRDRS